MTTTTPTAEIVAAETELAHAEAEVARIESALLAADPDPGATAAELVAAERIAEEHRAILTRARDLEAERNTREAERTRLARLDALADLIRTKFGEREGGIVDALDAAVVALVPLVREVAEHNTALRSVLADLADLAPLPADLRPAGTQLHLPGADVHIGEVNLERLLSEALWRATVAVDACGDARSGDALKAARNNFEHAAGVRRDREVSSLLGRPDLPNGSAAPVAPSDLLRRTARIVAERT